MPLIDILLPSFNNGRFLKTAVQSVIRQTLSDFTLWIVDDGTTDDSLKELPKDYRIKIRKNPGKGIVDALNYGISLSKAPWIARFDGDDIMHPKRLEKQLTFATNYRYDWVGSKVRLINHSSTKHGYRDYVDWNNGLITSEEMNLSRFIECPLIHPSWFLKSSIFKKHGNYKNGHFPEDYEFFLRVQKHVKTGKIDQYLLYWRDSPKRLSRTDERYSEAAFRNLKASHFPLSAETPFYIWGAGTEGKKLARNLIQRHFNLAGFLDVDIKKVFSKTVTGSKNEIYKQQPPKKTLNRPVFYYKDLLKNPSPPFIIIAVRKKGARQLIEDWLNLNGFEPGKHYLPFV